MDRGFSSRNIHRRVPVKLIGEGDRSSAPLGAHLNRGHPSPARAQAGRARRGFRAEHPRAVPRATRARRAVSEPGLD
eukprot:31229-Pelagococcus_subviridis.AAC.13